MVTETTVQKTALPTEQNEFVAKLGFDGRSPAAVSRASSIVIRTLEEYGHEVEKMQTQGLRRLSLDCDQFRVDLRHRRSPSPLRQYDGQACPSQLELHFTPFFPDHNDGEITELLIAMLLRNLAMEMEDAVTVSWIGESKPISAEDFLSAFIDHPADLIHEAATVDDGLIHFDTLEEKVAEDLETTAELLEKDFETIEVATLYESDRPVEASHVTPPTRPKGRARFAPVESTFAELSRHCDELVQSIASDTQTERRSDRIMGAREEGQLAKFAMTLFLAFISVPLAITVVAVNIVRTRNMRFGLQMSLVVALVLLMQTGSLVQAALQ